MCFSIQLSFFVALWALSISLRSHLSTCAPTHTHLPTPLSATAIKQHQQPEFQRVVTPLCTNRAPWTENAEQWEEWSKDFGAAANIISELRQESNYSNRAILFVGQSPAYFYNVLKEMRRDDGCVLLPFSGGRSSWERRKGPTDLFKLFYDDHKTKPDFLRHLPGYYDWCCDPDRPPQDEADLRACRWLEDRIKKVSGKELPTNEDDCMKDGNDTIDHNPFCYQWLSVGDVGDGPSARDAYCTKLVEWLGSGITMDMFNNLIVVDYSNSGSIDAFVALVASCGDGLALDGGAAGFAKGNLDGLKLKDGWNPVPFWNIRRMGDVHLNTEGPFLKFMKHTENIECLSTEEFVLDDDYKIPRLVPSYPKSEWKNAYEPVPHWGLTWDAAGDPSAVADCLTKSGSYYAQSPPTSGPSCRVSHAS